MFDVSRSARGARSKVGVASLLADAVRSRWVVGATAVALLALGPGAANAQTTLNLRSTAAVVAGYRDLSANKGSAAVAATTNTTAGGTRINWTDTAGGTALAWISPPLSASYNFNAAATCNVWARESNAAANTTVRCEIGRYTTSEQAANCTASRTGEIATTVTQYNWTCTNTTTTYNAGDRIVVRLFVANSGTMAAGYTQIGNYDAPATQTGDTYVSVPGTASFRTTTVGNGADPGAVTVAPGAATNLDAFTLATNNGTDSVGSITVTLAAGTAARLSLVEITNAAGSTVYGFQAPAGDVVVIPLGTSIPVTTTATTYYVRITPISHAAMPPPPGGSYAVTGTVTDFASANGHVKALLDSTSGTVTIDNQSPTPAVSGLTGTPDYGAIVVGWTGEPTDADFLTGGEVVVLRKVGSAPTEVPVEGTDYAGGETIGTATVACVANPGVRQCTASGLLSTSSYYFVAFARDVRLNYSVASASAGGYTPLAPVLPVTVGSASAVANNSTQVTVTAPFTGDVGGTPNSSTTVGRSSSSSGPFTNVTGCVGLTGASPRVCVDTTVVASTTFYYQVTFTDPDGVNGINPQVVSVTTPRSSYVLTVGGTAATATTPAPGTSGVVVGRITLQTTTGVGPVRVTGLRLQNTGTALAGNDVAAVQVYLDAGTLGALDAGDTLLGTAAWDGSRYSLQGLAQDVTTSVTNLLVTMAVSTGATNGRTFLTNLAAAAVTVVAPDTVAGSYASGTGATITATGVVQEGDPTANSTRPLVTILNPATGGTVTGTFRLQLKVWDPTSINNVTNLQWSVNNGSTWPQTINPSTQRSPNTANYDADTTRAAVYDITVTGLAPGSYSLKARASNDGGANYVMSGTVVVKAVAAPGGAGTLLVRDDSSQLCTDCHAGLKTHSSQNTTRSHGQWATNCRDCHTPHSTTNIGLVATQITPPQVTTVGQPPRAVKFSTRVGDSASSAVASASFVNSDNSGPCQVCHTRTINPGTAAVRWQNTGNADTHFDAASGTQACTGCHPHRAGFKGVESTGGAVDPVSYGKCSACHGGVFSTMSAASGSRHAIGNVVGTNDSYVDSGVTWGSPLNAVTPAQRSCVNMCHQDHVHNQVGGTSHSYGVFTDATATANRQVTRDAGGNITAGTPAATDFNAAATNGGLCLSCHRNPVESGATPARPAIAKAAYNASAHSFNATTAPAYSWRFTMHDGTAFVRNCTKCHASRTEGNTPVKGGAITAVHGTSDPFLLAGSKNPANAAGFVCYNCHGSAASPAAGVQGNRSNKNIQSQIAKASNHPADEDAVHDSVAEFNNASFGTFNAVARHSSCMDCHDPHEARAGTHAATTNLAGPPLEGAWGAQLSVNAAFWTAPASGNFTKKVIVAGTDVEATLCFKCHSGYYGTLPTSPSGGYQETDTAKEFNPGNAGNWATAGTANSWSANETAGGFHPVLASAVGNLGAVNMLNLNAAIITWRTSGARNLMTCTDCHESDTTTDPNGPHGSTAGFLLRGPNTAWNNTLVATASGMPANVFCANCHSNTWASSRFVPADGHTSRSAHRVACMNCHARIPHGGPRPGILVAPAGAAAGVGGTIAGWDTSSVYSNPGTGNTLYLASYPTNNTTNWAQGNCGCNGTGHCLPLYALIDTPAGEIPVSLLKVGDLVYTQDASGARVVEPIGRLEWLPVGARHRLVELSLADGRVVRASEGHPLPDGTVFTDVRPGAFVDGSIVTDVRVMEYDGGRTWDLLPEGETGSYWADGVLLGSTLAPEFTPGVPLAMAWSCGCH